MEKKELPCTWNNASACKDCGIGPELNCRWRKEHLMYFMVIAMPVMTMQLLAYLFVSLLIDNFIPIAAYVLFWPIVLGIWEIKFLCSHCPYYAREGAVLHCLANHGALRIWKYNPAPMNRTERLLMGGLLAIIGIGLPAVSDIWLLVLLLRSMPQHLPYALILLGFHAVMIALLEILAARVALKDICSRCVNFSCPVNRVPKAVVDRYLEINAVMKKAWLEAGYRPG